MDRCKGPDPHNSCKTCNYWHHGQGVSHNHCDLWIHDDRRANGHWELWGNDRSLKLCVFHSDPGLHLGEDKEFTKHALKVLACRM